MDSNASLAPTPHNVEQLLERSTLTQAKMGEKTMVLHCTLPNDYEITVSSAPVDPGDYDDEVGLEACMDKLERQIIDLLAFQQHGELE